MSVSDRAVCLVYVRNLPLLARYPSVRCLLMPIVSKVETIYSGASNVVEADCLPGTCHKGSGEESRDERGKYSSIFSSASSPSDRRCCGDAALMG